MASCDAHHRIALAYGGVAREGNFLILRELEVKLQAWRGHSAAESPQAKPKIRNQAMGAMLDRAGQGRTVRPNQCRRTAVGAHCVPALRPLSSNRYFRQKLREHPWGRHSCLPAGKNACATAWYDGLEPLGQGDMTTRGEAFAGLSV